MPEIFLKTAQKKLKKLEKIEVIEKLIIAYAKGEFSTRAEPFPTEDYLNAILHGLNLLGEELEEKVHCCFYTNSILDSIKTPVFIVDENFHIIQSNSSATEHLKHSKDEFKKMSFEKLLLSKLDFDFLLNTNTEVELLDVEKKPTKYTLEFSKLHSHNQPNEGSWICHARIISESQ